MQTMPFSYRIKLFALFRERLGREDWCCESHTLLSARALLQIFFEENRELAGLARSTRLAVNQRFTAKDLTLTPTDELALIPPVSGG